MYRPLRSLGTIALFACLVLLAAPPARAGSETAVVTALRGNVQYEQGGVGPFLPLRYRASLYPGDVVRAGSDGETELLFLGDGTYVKVKSGATFRLSSDRRSLFQIILGVVWAHLRPETEIAFPGHTNAVTHGTEILADVAADGATTLTVLEGEVSFANPLGARELSGSEQSIARPGQAPTPPVAVDPSGLIDWTADVAALPLEFELPALTPGPNGPRDFSAEASRREAQVQTTPGDAAAWVSLGQARRGLGDLAGALAAFAQAETLSPDNADARVGMALTNLSQGDPTMARAALEPVQGQPMAQAVLGLADLHEGRAEDAEQSLQAALAQSPTLYQARALLALALLSRDDVPDAEKSARQAVADQPNSAQAQGALALALFFAGQPGEAEKVSRRAVHLNPQSPFALLTEGRALLAQQQTDAARTAYEKAASFAPYLPLVHEELGTVYQRLDMPRKAAEEYGQALKLDPNSAGAHTGLGLVDQSQGRDADAEREHLRALQLAPNNTTAIYNLAALYIDRGRLEDARRLLERGVRTDPNRGILYARLAEIFLYRQDLFTAQDYARRAVSLLPDSALTHYELGRVYFEQERTTQAEQEFREATTLDRQFAAARYALGLTEDTAALGQDTSQPLGQIAAVEQSASASILNIQNLQSMGAPERIQAAIQDPTVARIASRSFGDAQLDTRIGDFGSRASDFSYLHESNDRRVEGGLSAQTTHSNGVRTNDDTTDDHSGALFGIKSADNSTGLFAQGQYEHLNFGGDYGPMSDPTRATRRSDDNVPTGLIGAVLRNGESQDTQLLAQADQPIGSETDVTGYTKTHGRSYHGEIRHDALLWRNNLISIGGATGFRHFGTENLFELPPPFPGFPGINFETDIGTTLSTFQAYARDQIAFNSRCDLTLEMKFDRLDYRIDSSGNPETGSAPTVGLPTALLEYQPDASDGFRFRARKLFGTVDDFELLAPRDVFLFSSDNVPGLKLGAVGASYEFEYDHTFRDASFLRLGLFQQDLRDAEDVNGEYFPRVRFQSAQLRYEGILTPTTTYFVDGNLTKSNGGIANSDGSDLSPGQSLSLIPGYGIEAGVQYLDRKGWFVQPSYAYEGPREEPLDNLGDPRESIGGFGIVNARVGKRWGLRYTAFAEVVNAFGKDYTILGGDAERLQLGRQIRVGLSFRF